MEIQETYGFPHFDLLQQLVLSLSPGKMVRLFSSA